MIRKLSLLIFLNVLLFSCSKDDVTEEEKQKPQLAEIGNFAPAKVDLGDTITISGKNFSRDIRLSLNDRELPLILNNDSLIKFQVPYFGYNPFNFEIKVNDQAQETKVFKNPFELYEPRVDSIPSNFGFRERVTIYGKHLTNVSGKTHDIIYLNNEAIDVLSHSKDSIVFQLPYLSRHDHDLLIKAQLQEVRLPKGVKVAAPSIDSISVNSAKVGDVIKIYGQYFYPYSSNTNKVFFDGIPTEIVEAHPDSLIVKMPIGPYKDREINSVQVELFGKEISEAIDLYLEDTWYMHDFIRDREVSNTGYASNISSYSFTDQNKFYLNSYKNVDYEVYNAFLFEYDPVSQTMEELAPIPIEKIPGMGYNFHFYPFGDGSHVYIYINRKEDNFFKYNYKTGELTVLADFEDEVINDAIGTFLNGNFHFGMGHTGHSSIVGYNKIWVYNEVADTWNLSSERPYESEYAYNSDSSVFVFDNKLYIGNGGERQYQFWEFSSGNWTEKSSLQDPLPNTVSFQTENKGFYYHPYKNVFWEYDVRTNAWTSRKDLALGRYGVGEETILVLDEYVYFIGYSIGYPYDESGIFRSDHFVLRTEISNLNK